MNSITIDFTNKLESLYGLNEPEINYQKKRFKRLAQKYQKLFGESDLLYFSTPGRTELSGNHTDHNLGKVLAASISLDAIATVGINNSEIVNLYSENYDKTFEVNLNKLPKIDSENHKTISLIRGISARFIELGYKVGGFNAVLTSDVLTGSGLSSSACFEVLIATIINHCFNNGKIGNLELAKIGQWAENNYFGKPCGLMDQLACAVGGIINIDFIDVNKPLVEKIEFDFGFHEYKLLIVDTGDNHEDLTEEYASIPQEMNKVASLFNKNSCRELSLDDFIAKLPIIRSEVGDRAALRVFHFLNENERVTQQVNNLRQRNFDSFLKLVEESGNSSFKWLQNIYSPRYYNKQSTTLALAFTEKFIKEKDVGKCRIHGGGFAGAIQVFLPNRIVNEYKNYIENELQIGKVLVLDIRNEGTVFVNRFEKKNS